MSGGGEDGRGVVEWENVDEELQVEWKSTRRKRRDSWMRTMAGVILPYVISFQ